MIFTQKNPIYSFLINRVMPDSDCFLCNQRVKSGSSKANLICEHCHQRLPRLKNGCVICAMPIFDKTLGSLSNTCGACLKHAPSFSKTIAPFHYEMPISELITSLKFNGQLHFVLLLSEYLLDKVRKSYQSIELPEAIIAVPLHSSKVRERGFNQALLIAQYLSSQLNVPIRQKAVKRIRYTKAQSSLDAIQRQRNLKGAFSVDPIKLNRVAIVDDVMTTGATANELSVSLLKAGVSHVDIWCIARAFSV